MIQKIAVNGVELNVHVAGSGPVILFVHGFPLDHTMWRAQLTELAASFRVIAPDLRGFGKSGGASAAFGASTLAMEQLADDLAALLDPLKITEPVTYCGLSMGGYIAWAFVRKHGKRLRRLILCDTKAVADTPDAAQGRLQLAEHVLANGPAKVADTMLPRLIAATTAERSPAIAQALRETIMATPSTTIAAALRGLAARPDSTSLLPAIRIPTLVVCGTDDKIASPDEMRGIADQIPGATFVEIPEAGHMSPMENPSAVNSAILKFLVDTE